MPYLILLTIFVLAILFIYIPGKYFYNYSIGRNKKNSIFNNNNFFNTNKSIQKNAEEFVSNLSPTEIQIKSFDGLNLNGIYVENCNNKDNHKWVICIHGYYEVGRKVYKYAQKFYENGYSFLIPDGRGHGRSEGDFIGMGWYDRLDVMKWIDEVLKIDSEAEIVLFGVSMGSATVCMTSGEDLPTNVKCIIADCGYSSVLEEFEFQYRKNFKRLPKFPFFYAMDLYSRIKTGYAFKDASAVKQVKKSKTPIFFIHGDKDKFVPVDMAYKLYESAACKKDLFIVEGAGHIQSADVAKDEYWKKIFRFIDNLRE